MISKTVLVLEDDDVVRDELRTGLQKKGINTIVADRADEAWKLLEDVPNVDVVVLDIRLEKGVTETYRRLPETGFDFGLRLKRERSAWPPEFLVHSAYEDIDYYQAALKLEVVAYLKKGTISGVNLTRVELVAQHVRALALRRGLRSPGMTDRLHDIAARSESSGDAIERFCREVLSDELEATLGPDYILLLTQSDKTVPFSGRPLAHASNKDFQELQKAVHARMGSIEPFIVNSDSFSSSYQEREALRRVLRPIEGAAFIELGEIKSARLSLGLVPGAQSLEGVKEQVKLLDRYLQKPVIAQLLEITERWAELDLKRRFEAEKRRVLLDATSNFCLYQAEEIGHALQDSPHHQDNREGLIVQVNKLKAIAAEMRDAGEILNYFAYSNEALHAQPNVDVAQLVERIWSDEVSPALHFSQPGILKVVPGGCVASDQPERAERAVSQILGWMGRRLIRSRAEEGMALLVECHLTPGLKRVQVTFEEHSSRRLPPELRKSLFEPFYTQTTTDLGDEKIDGGRRLGLFLAKTLAGLAGGALEDHSDELSGGLGHRFVLELPAASNVA